MKKLSGSGGQSVVLLPLSLVSFRNSSDNHSAGAMANCPCGLPGYTNCECQVRINHRPNSNRRRGGEFGGLSFRAARLPV